MRSILAIVLCMSAGSALAQQTDYDSGNHMLSHCKTGIDGSSGDLNVWVGQCSGAIAALTFMAPALNASERFCPPKNYSVLQARRVAVRYMEQHPETLHVNFMELALRAFKEAWQCSMPPK